MTSLPQYPLSPVLMKAVECEHASFTFPITDYLARIGLDKQTTEEHPSLALLQKIMAAHSSSIPFENLDCFMDRVISLDLHDLCNKLIYAKRGGYCFEQNSLLLAALQSLRFANCRALSGRVLLGDGGEEDSLGRTHMTLLIPLKRFNDNDYNGVDDAEYGMYIVDVGFGAYYSLAPLSLNLINIPQDTPGGTFRILKQTRYVDLPAIKNGSTCTFETSEWEQQEILEESKQEQELEKKLNCNYISDATNNFGWDEFTLQVDLNSLKEPKHYSASTNQSGDENVNKSKDNLTRERKWLSMYSFDLQPQCAQDFNIYSYYIRTNSFFTHSLLALRARGTWTSQNVNFNGGYDDPKLKNNKSDHDNASKFVCEEVLSLVDCTVKKYTKINNDDDDDEANNNLNTSRKTTYTSPEELYDAITTQFGICCESNAFPQYAISREAFVQQAKAKLSAFGGTGYTQHSVS